MQPGPLEVEREVLVGRGLREAVQFGLVVQPDDLDLLLVRGQAGGDIRELEEERVADDVEQRRWGQSRWLSRLR